MDLGIPAIATSMANMETSQEMAIGTVRRAIGHTEMVGEAIAMMMESMAQITGEGMNVNVTV